MVKTTLTEEEIAFRNAWYSEPFILEGIRRQYSQSEDNQMFTREMAFFDKIAIGKDKLPTFRLMLAYSMSSLMKNIERFEFIQKNYCIFKSLMCYDKIPIVSWDMKVRKEEYTQWYGKADVPGDYAHHSGHYEFTLDLDGQEGDLSGVILDARKLANYFESLDCPYAINFSGNKGFHFTIPLKYFVAGFREVEPNWTPEVAPDICSQIASFLKEKQGIGSIDEGIYDDHRLMRTIWGLDTRNGNHHVVLPIWPQELARFTKNFAFAEPWLKKVDVLKTRGFCLRNSQGNIKKLVEACFG